MNTKAMKRVVQLNSDGKYIAEFPSIAAAARAISSSHANVYNCCHNRNNCRTVRGYIFVLWENYNPFHDYSFHFNENRKQVARCTLDGEILEKFDSITDAASQYHAASARLKIGKCCNGKAKTYAGWVWKFI